VTDRLYTSMAAGCVPVVIADEVKGAFASRVRYEDWWVRVPMRDFVRRPERLLEVLRGISAQDLERRQRRLQEHRADVLYDAEGSRVGSNFLDELEGRCVPYLTNRSGYPPPRSAQKWLRRCLALSAGSGDSGAVDTST